MKTKSKDRVAPREAITADGQHFIPGSVISCAEENCDHSARINSNKISGRLPDVVLRKKFTMMGWRMKGSKWLCPDHAYGRRPSKPEPTSNIIELQPHIPAPEVVAPAPTAPVVAAAPPPKPTIPEPKKETPPMATTPTPLRSFADLASASIERMTPSDRRRIFRAIDENWDDDAGRYIGGMGDQGIASQLNVARAWVEHVRKDSFGDSADNEDMEKLREELAELKGKVGVSLDEMQRLQSKVKEFGDQAATVAERLRTYFSRLTDLEKRLGATERAVGVRR
jgi:hypothetical protein